MFSTSHLHPMLVHFPIALVAIGFLAEFAFLLFKKEVCLTKIGFYLLVIGTLTACATWLSGDLFTSEMSGAAGEIRETHELLATITVVLLIATLVLRSALLFKKSENTKLNTLAFVLYGLAALSVSATGFFGGTLVYNYMMPL
ncbi:MAG TPA: DUF2231 domain-containing protein [Paludibacter sp.]